MGGAEVKNALIKYHKFLITSHKRPEGDSVGSVGAMYLLLKKLGKEVLVTNEDVVPRNLDFIKFCEVKTPQQAVRFNYDVAVVVDCADLSRIGSVVDLIESKPIINIDHHISNTNFGDINWVDTDASSAAEIIFRLFKEMKIELDKKTALCLYVGMLTDTGSFRFSNTSPATLRACAELLELKIEPEKIANLLYNRRSFGAMRLLGEALIDLKKDETGRICWLKITPQMLKEAETTISECDDFIEFVRMIETVDVAVIFYCLDENRVRVSFRSKGTIDVNETAFSFNGGGHRLASGAEIEDSIETVEKIVIQKIKEQMGYY